MKRLFVIAVLALASLSLAACSSMGKKKGAAGVDDRGGAAGAGAAGGGAWSGNPLDDPSSPLSKRVIYFEYDSSEVLAADRETVAAHARYLAANPNLSVTLEGHADERGSREYNIALGERRAQSVRSLMELQGASSNQMRTVSYGEEKPMAAGSDEYSWQQNRRVEIVYQGQ